MCTAVIPLREKRPVREFDHSVYLRFGMHVICSCVSTPPYTFTAWTGLYTLFTLSLRTALVWSSTQRVVAIPYRHFGKTCPSQLPGSRIRILSPKMGVPYETLNLAALVSSRFLTLEDGPIGCPETSVRNCHYSLRYSPEERGWHLLRGGRLKSHVPCGFYSRLLAVVTHVLWPTS
jgi:hypothetical protein